MLMYTATTVIAKHTFIAGEFVGQDPEVVGKTLRRLRTVVIAIHQYIPSPPLAYAYLRSLSMRLSGLMSAWMIPQLWRVATIERISLAKYTIRPSSTLS